MSVPLRLSTPTSSHTEPLTDPIDAGDLVALSAVRAFLRAPSRREAATVLQQAVVSLGGLMVPPERPTALPVDVSLGIGEALVVEPCDDAALERLVRILPSLVEDALVAASRCDDLERQAHRASVDALTGVASRREIPARLGRSNFGDAVCLVDLDGFKALNDTRGHNVGDEALRRFGDHLRSRVRAGEFVGRYGGDEFVVVLTATPVRAAARRLRDIGHEWSEMEQWLPTMSGGVARVDSRGGHAALLRADHALYRAKAGGRDRVEAEAEPVQDRRRRELR